MRGLPRMEANPGLAMALAAVAIIAIADSPRVALLAALAAVALATTRVRFSAGAALAVLLVAALLALGGWGPAFDQRPAQVPASPARSAAR